MEEYTAWQFAFEINWPLTGIENRSSCTQTSWQYLLINYFDINQPLPGIPRISFVSVFCTVLIFATKWKSIKFSIASRKEIVGQNFKSGMQQAMAQCSGFTHEWSRHKFLCYSDLLWEKIVLVIEKNFWNSKLKAENLKKFWDHFNNLFEKYMVRTVFELLKGEMHKKAH